MSVKCDCFKEKIQLVKDKVGETLPEGIKNFEIRWNNEVWIIDGRDSSPVNPQVKYEYHLPKKGGGYRVNKTKKEVSLMAKFCCFCGRKYEVKSK